MLSLRLCDFLQMKSTDDLSSELWKDLLLSLDIESMSNENLEECYNILTKWCINIEDLHSRLRMIGLLFTKRMYNAQVGESGDVIDGL